MGTGVRAAVEGYIDLGTQLMKSWGDHARKIATRLDTEQYTLDEAVADTAEWGALTVQSVFYIFNEAFDAAAVLTGKQDQPHILTAGPFTTSRTVAAGALRSLQLTGPMKASLGPDALPV